MNPDLDKLQPYPFEKLRALFAGVAPSAAHAPISLSIGEPKHATPEFIKEALTAQLSGLARYPLTAGSPALREAIAAWLAHRYSLPAVDPATQVLPVNGSREALFAIAQTVIDRTRNAVVVCPNPFYQIYEGAALLAGAVPNYAHAVADRGFAVDYDAVPAGVWPRVQLLYACSPANPTGHVMTLEEWGRLFDLADRHGFVIASDECYSELYFEEARPPLGALEAAHRLGRGDFRRIVVFSSLSKRSNVPGMRSGFAAGDATVLRRFLLYRTYHGGAMSPAVQAASEAAWRDEGHVRENRRLYREKFAAALPLVKAPLETAIPDGGFYLWIRTPIDDAEFARELYRQYNVAVLPGSYLAREAGGENPGRNHIRAALVAQFDECIEGVRRIAEFARSI
ncbi:MAG TPA: succinyldiaminopimelate transaminase [Burkholderiales bacterium]|jgi:N-succinyldiaminopimelate aminotransferase|nr:succinyldiaminopimelate transaminase [Burkholderiales bacterium]